MSKLIHVILFSSIGVIIFVLIDISASNEVSSPRLHRSRRYLSFLNVSHFYIRLNFKANMVPWNQIFAQALGYRMNFDEPQNSRHFLHHIHRRTAYNYLENLLNRNDFDGFHCIRRAICELDKTTTREGIYHTILKIIFRKHSSETDRWHNVSSSKCAESSASCPFSLLDVSMFTDI